MITLLNIIDTELIDKIGIIYLIRNKITGNVYIGKSINSIKVRYFGSSKVFRTHNDDLQMDLYKYGLDNFTIELLIENILDDEVLRALEEYLILEYSNIFEMYNNKLNKQKKILSEMELKRIHHKGKWLKTIKRNEKIKNNRESDLVSYLESLVDKQLIFNSEEQKELIYKLINKYGIGDNRGGLKITTINNTIKSYGFNIKVTRNKINGSKKTIWNIIKIENNKQVA